MKLSYQLFNFKAFRDTGVIDLAPITIFCGENSIGKSSILKSLLLLKQSTIERRSRLTRNAPMQPLLFNGELTRLGSWTDTVNGKSRDQTIGMSWKASGVAREVQERVGARSRRRELPEKAFNLNLDLKLRSVAGTSEELSAVLSSANITSDDLSIEFFEEKRSSTYNGKYIINVNSMKSLISTSNGFMSPYFYSESVKGIVKSMSLFSESFQTGSVHVLLEGPCPLAVAPHLDSSWTGFFETVSKSISQSRSGARGPQPRWLESFNKAFSSFKTLTANNQDYKVDSPRDDLLQSLARLVCTALDGVLDHCQSVIGSEWKNLRYIGPLRHQPQRFYQFDDTGGIDIGVSGEFTVQVLALEAQTKINASGVEFQKNGRIELRPVTTKTLLDAVNDWLEVMDLPAVHPGALKQSLYELRVGKLDVALPDVGFGVSQILPIIVEVLRCRKGETIILEQPEIHLHPRIQSFLADFFISRAFDGIKFVIESHSEYMIKRICRRIAENNIPNISDIANIVFVEQEKNNEVTCTKIQLNQFGEIEKWPRGFFDTQEDLYWAKAALERRKAGRDLSRLTNI